MRAQDPHSLPGLIAQGQQTVLSRLLSSRQFVAEQQETNTSPRPTSRFVSPPLSPRSATARPRVPLPSTLWA